MLEATDDDLIGSYRGGQVEAFERLYRRHASGVFTFLRMQAGGEAEDLLQETFSRVAAGLPRYRSEGRFQAWLYAIARNLVRDRYRRPQREVSLDDQAEACEPVERDLAERQTSRVVVRQALMALPAEQREVVLLREYGDLTFSEISRILGCPTNTAITRMHRALERLRRALVPEEVESIEL